MSRVLTVAREYGSGGGHIACTVAERLGWNLLDKALVEAIARSAQVDPDLARQYDERVDSWLHRISRRSLWHGAFAKESRRSVMQRSLMRKQWLNSGEI